jgi:hypothetical protein
MVLIPGAPPSKSTTPSKIINRIAETTHASAQQALVARVVARKSTVKALSSAAVALIKTNRSRARNGAAIKI